MRGAAAGTVLKFHVATGAVPGERIVGIVTPGDGITIYPIFAEALEQFDSQPERWVDLAWGVAEEGQRFPARIRLALINEVGAPGPGDAGDRRARAATSTSCSC